MVKGDGKKRSPRWNDEECALLVHLVGVSKNKKGSINWKACLDALAADPRFAENARSIKAIKHKYHELKDTKIPSRPSNESDHISAIVRSNKKTTFTDEEEHQFKGFYSNGYDLVNERYNQWLVANKHAPILVGPADPEQLTHPSQDEWSQAPSQPSHDDDDEMELMQQRLLDQRAENDAIATSSVPPSHFDSLEDVKRHESTSREFEHKRHEKLKEVVSSLVEGRATYSDQCKMWNACMDIWREEMARYQRTADLRSAILDKLYYYLTGR